MSSFSHLQFWSVSGMAHRAILSGKWKRARQIIRRGIEIGAFEKDMWKTAVFFHTDVSRKPRSW